MQKRNKEGSSIILDESGKLCGAALTYAYLLKEGYKEEVSPYKRLISLSNYHDLWHYNKCDCEKNYAELKYCSKCTAARDVDRQLSALGRNRFMSRYTLNPDTKMTDMEKSIVDSNKDKVREIIAELEPISIDGCEEVKFVTVPAYPNEAAEWLLHDQNSMVALIFNRTYGTLSVRIHKDCDIDAGAVLKSLNSSWGGHKKASGTSNFKLEEHGEMIFNAFVDEVSKLKEK